MALTSKQMQIVNTFIENLVEHHEDPEDGTVALLEGMVQDSADTNQLAAHMRHEANQLRQDAEGEQDLEYRNRLIHEARTYDQTARALVNERRPYPQQPKGKIRNL